MSSRLMTSLLAVALAVSTLAVPGALAGLHDCCKRAGAPTPVRALQCCMPERPEQSSRQAPPQQSASTTTQDLLPLPAALAAAPVLLVPTEPPVDRPDRLVTPPDLYIRHATLLV